MRSFPRTFVLSIPRSFVQRLLLLPLLGAGALSGVNCTPPALPHTPSVRSESRISGSVATAVQPSSLVLGSEHRTPTPKSSAFHSSPIDPHSLLEFSEQFGESVQGRPLIAHVLGNGPNVTLIFGAVHGCERNTVGMVKRLHEYLLKHPEAWENCRVIVAPCVNPDGWHSNERRNANNVDLNRNYPVGWHRYGNDTEYAPGPHPLSEPESRAVLELIQRYKPAKVISVHGYAHMLLCEGGQTHKIANVMQSHNGYRIRDDIGYPTPGSLGKYLSVKEYKPGLLTLELPHSSIASVWQQNKQALLAAIKLKLP